MVGSSEGLATWKPPPVAVLGEVVVAVAGAGEGAPSGSSGRGREGEWGPSAWVSGTVGMESLAALPEAKIRRRYAPAMASNSRSEALFPGDWVPEKPPDWGEE